MESERSDIPDEEEHTAPLESFETNTSGQPDEPQQPEPSGSHWLLWLFFRPRQFFAHFVAHPNAVMTIFACYLFGIANATERIDSRLLREDLGRSSAMASAAQSWVGYWVIVILGAAFSALLIYSLGGWWYRKRVEMCADGAVETRLARRVYVFASLVWVIPSILYSVWAASTYATPAAANRSDDWGSLALFVFLFWSLVTSYKGVTSCFNVRRRTARLWFLVLPATLYIVLIGGAFVVGMFLAFTASEPELTRTTSHHGSTFSLRYPGNWVIDKTGLDYDPDTYIRIAPTFGDCVIVVEVVEDTTAEALSTTVRSFVSDLFKIEEWTGVTTWRTDAPLFHRGSGSFENQSYTCEVSVHGKEQEAKADAGTRIVFWSLCLKSQADVLDPGLAYIRRSLRFK